MFELLQAYETAKHEKNKILRFFYVRYVRHKLKSSFFKPFRRNIEHMILNKDLINEFYQFFLCTHLDENLRYRISNQNPMINFTSAISDRLHIHYHDYLINYKFFDYTCDVEVETYDKAVITHFNNEEFYSSFFAEIILMAIYNYCVMYIYGEDSKLYIHDKSYIKRLKSMYY